MVTIPFLVKREVLLVLSIFVYCKNAHICYHLFLGTRNEWDSQGVLHLRPSSWSGPGSLCRVRQTWPHIQYLGKRSYVNLQVNNIKIKNLNFTKVHLNHNSLIDENVPWPDIVYLADKIVPHTLLTGQKLVFFIFYSFLPHFDTKKGKLKTGKKEEKYKKTTHSQTLVNS